MNTVETTQSQINFEALSESALAEKFGLTDEHFARFAAAAQRIYLSERWDDAADAYFFLSTVKPLQPTYWIGLGLSEQKRQNHEVASQALGMAATLRSSDPYPTLLLAKCLRAQGEKGEAGIAIDRALRLASLPDGDPKLLQRAQRLKREWR